MGIMEAERKKTKTVERYHIHEISKDRLHMYDIYTDTRNPKYGTLQELSTG
jgi:hypothetical protein